MSGSDAGGDADCRVRRRLVVALLFLVGAVHAPAWFGDYVYDDVLLVVQNTALQTGDVAALLARPLFDGVADYWRPVTMLGLWLGDRVGGAAGVHVLAWLAHLLATWFAWRVASRVVDRPAPAFFAALLFGVHPVQVEGVAWCASLNDPVWWACGLWCLDAALRTAPRTAAVAFLLALLAKENAIVVLPLAVVAAWQARLRPGRVALPLLAVAALWWLLRAWAFGAPAAGIGHREDDPVALAHWPLAAVEVFGRELELLVWPWPMSPFRAFDGAGPTIARSAVWVFVWAVATGTAAGRGARRAVFALAIVGAPPLLAAVFAHRLGPYPIADRYLGPAVLGAALLVVGQRPGRLRLGIAAGIAVVCLVATPLQSGIWRDAQRLAQHGLAVAPDDPGVLVMAGNGWLDAGDVARARAAYADALTRARPERRGVQSRIALDAELGLAWCLLRGAPPDPRRAAQGFAEVVRRDPANVHAWIGLGVAHGMAGDAIRAEQALRRAIELDPDDSRAHFNLAFLLRGLGRLGEARASASEAVRSNPGNAAAAEMLRELDDHSRR